MSKNAGKCFVICPIGDPGTETRKRSDQVLEHVIRPAVAPLGYEVLRADKIAEPGLITSQVIQHVIEDSLVIADLTDRNPNVFYELAIRHAVKKPLIQLIRAGDKLPFDVAGMRTISVDHKDLDSVDEAKQEIARQIIAMTEAKTEIETPISVSVELQALKKSDRPEDRTLAEIISEMTELRKAVSLVEVRINKSSDEAKLMHHDMVSLLISRLDGRHRLEEANTFEQRLANKRLSKLSDTELMQLVENNAITAAEYQRLVAARQSHKDPIRSQH